MHNQRYHAHLTDLDRQKANSMLDRTPPNHQPILHLQLFQCHKATRYTKKKLRLKEALGLATKYYQACLVRSEPARDYVFYKRHMNRGTINLEDMAEAMGMSMKPFFQKVHDITGKTPAEIVRDLRLRHACILLQRTNINMSELASHVGFATGEHFINLFKERFGMTPSEYRLKHRK